MSSGAGHGLPPRGLKLHVRLRSPLPGPQSRPDAAKTNLALPPAVRHSMYVRSQLPTASRTWIPDPGSRCRPLPSGAQSRVGLIHQQPPRRLDSGIVTLHTRLAMQNLVELGGDRSAEWRSAGCAPNGLSAGAIQAARPTADPEPGPLLRSFEPQHAVLDLGVLNPHRTVDLSIQLRQPMTRNCSALHAGLLRPARSRSIPPRVRAEMVLTGEPGRHVLLARIAGGRWQMSRPADKRRV
ncbi:hypothetical protein CALCODRAFT_205215 [Calocera cornea HHB12733]|uniref:Uncharacterized protein n=1 Tax=Calocera cornea HHB12733 TaxID=1353952 RepID=A0A165K0P8_9BASI|nr:hypothetical protein CALCODRAFT_205215 [Calocera cornea HHB12733]